MVCPALLPPAQRAHTSTSDERISTSFPFPSSPHCAPSTTETIAIRVNICKSKEMNSPLTFADFWDLSSSIYLFPCLLGALGRSEDRNRQKSCEMAVHIKRCTWHFLSSRNTPLSGPGGSNKDSAPTGDSLFRNGGVPLEFSKPKCCQPVGQEASQRLWNPLSAAYGRCFVRINYIHANALRSAWPESEDSMFWCSVLASPFTLRSLWFLPGDKRRRVEIEER